MRYNSKPVMRVAVVMGIGILCVISYLLAPEFMQRITHLFLAGDVVGSIEFIKSYGPYAIFMSFLI